MHALQSPDAAAERKTFLLAMNSCANDDAASSPLLRASFRATSVRRAR